MVGTIAGAILGSFLGASAGDALFKEPDYVTGAIQAVETDWVDVKILVKELLPAEVEARLNNAAKHIRRQITALNNSSVENSEIKMRTALQVEIERALMSLENVSRLLKHDVGQGNTGFRQGPSNPIPAPETNHKTKQSGQPTSTRRAR